jgi:uncharacterized membrane protein YphA (DoxX/SURF4 family)
MTDTRDKTVLTSAELNAARFLIASYFLAVAVGLAEGVSLTPIFGVLFGEGGVSSFLSHTVLFVMGVLVLLGIAQRQVALTMAGLLLATNILELAATGKVDSAGVWRDIALVGALILSYGQREGFFTRKPTPLNRREDDKGASGDRKQQKLTSSLEKLFRDRTMV